MSPDQNWLRQQWALAAIRRALSDDFDLFPWERRNLLRRAMDDDFSVFLEERDRLKKKLKLMDDVCSLKRY